MSSSMPPPVRRSSTARSAPVVGADQRAMTGILFAVGAVLLPAGLVVIMLGWYGAARTPHLYDQLSYLISGGLLGLALVFVGGMLFFGTWISRLSASARERNRRLSDHMAVLQRHVDVDGADVAPLAGTGTARVIMLPEPRAAAAAEEPPTKRGLFGRRGRQKAGREISGREILFVLLLAMITELVAFEITLINPGLPEIARAFDVSSVHWVLTVLFVVSAATVPVTGKIGDIHGKRKVLLVGLGIYALGSAICATTDSYALFLAGRAMQAIMLAGPAMAFALVRDVLRPSVVPLAVGGILAGSGMSAILGPILGGVFVQTMGYHASFWFLGVHALVLLLLTTRMPSGRIDPDPAPIDWRGAAMLMGAAVLVTLGLELPVAFLVPAVGLGLVGFVLLYRRFRSMDEPLVDVRLLTGDAMRMTLLVAACGAIAMNSSPFLMPSLLRPEESGQVMGLGLTPIQMGLMAGLPLGLSNTIAAFVGGIVSKRRSPRLAARASMLAFAVAAASFASLALGAPSAVLVLASASIGVAIGLFLSSTAVLVVEAVPATAQGATTGAKYSWEAVCGGIGIALVAAVMRPGLVVGGDGHGGAAYSAGGLVTGYALVAFVAVVGYLVATRMQHGRRPASGGAVAAE
jgi:MFS family permease